MIQHFAYPRRQNRILTPSSRYRHSSIPHHFCPLTAIEGLTQWHDQIPGCRPYTKGSMAGQLQDSIGWGLALEGCIVKEWQEEQELYWKAFKSCKSSK